MKTIKEWILHAEIVFVVVWFIVLFLRSALYIRRVVKELNEPSTTLFEEVKKCSGSENYSGERRMYYNYLTLGEKCEK